MAERTLFGFHPVASCLRHRADTIRDVYFDAARNDQRIRQLASAFEHAGVRVSRVTAARLTQLAGDAAHQGVVARVESVPLAKNLDSLLDALLQPALLLVLDGIQDPHNLGACLRVADAMGVHAVVAPKDRAVSLTPTVAKVASGAAETVPYFAVTNLARTLREMKERSIWVIGTHHEADENLSERDLTEPLALVMGAEGEGLRRLTRETCDHLIRIPMVGTVASLNVSVAAGICLYETCRQRSLKLPIG